jgi:cell division protein FtsB
MSTFSFSQFVVSYLPIAISVAGTIAVALGGFSAFRTNRAAALLEATTTWRELAEARQARITALETENARLEAELHNMRRNLAYLWEQIHMRDGTLVQAPPLLPNPVSEGHA